MKKIPLSTVVVLFVFVSLFFVSIIAMVLLFPKITNKDQASFWNELIKMIFSSLLSATVAYIVSIVQNNSIQNRQEKEELQTNLKRIKLLVIEIKDNKDVLERMQQGSFQIEKSLIEKQISKKIYDMYLDKMDLDDLVLENLIKYDKKLSLFLNGAKEQMESNYTALIDSIDRVLDGLGKVCIK